MAAFLNAVDKVKVNGPTGVNQSTPMPAELLIELASSSPSKTIIEAYDHVSKTLSTPEKSKKEYVRTEKYTSTPKLKTESESFETALNKFEERLGARLDHMESMISSNTARIAFIEQYGPK